MAKKAYTDYFTGVVEEVVITSFDGHKYATVKRCNGEKDTLRFTFLYKDAKMLQTFSSMEWRMMSLPSNLRRNK